MRPKNLCQELTEMLRAERLGLIQQNFIYVKLSGAPSTDVLIPLKQSPEEMQPSDGNMGNNVLSCNPSYIY